MAEDRRRPDHRTGDDRRKGNDNGGGLNITPDTTRGSFLHWVVQYDGRHWGRNVAVYLTSVVGIYGVMALVAVTQIAPIGRPPVSIFNDWPVVFAFWVSLPVILFLVASDQQALDLAMKRVLAAGVVTSSKQFAEEFKDIWTKKFWALNIRVQVLAPLLAMILSYFTAYLFKAAGAQTWAQTTTLNNYAYMIGIALFYMLLITYIVRGVAMAVLLKSVANECTIKLIPLHPDGCGGLQPLGRMGLRNQYALTILGINIAVLAIMIYRIDPSLELVIVVPALAVYLIFGPVIFLGPLLPFRRVMGDRRRDLMQEIAAPLDAKLDSFKKQARAHRNISQDEFEALERLRAIGKAVGELPIWPFDTPTMRVFATAYVIPVFLAAATKLAELIVEHVTK